MIVHPGTREALLRFGRSGIEALMALYSQLRRKRLVIAQYDTDLLASDYECAHALSRPEGRHLRSRIRLVYELLAGAPKGMLLDAGCGPGVLVRTLLTSKRHDYSVTVLDQSQAMVKCCVASTSETGGVRATVGDLQTLPFADGTFDVTVATGSLEYTDAKAAIGQLSRVTRQGGVVLISMLNPVSPYRLTEWFLYWPTLRAFSALQRLSRFRTRRPHGAKVTGIRALTATTVRRHMRQAGLVPYDLVYFDLTPLVPPLDRIPVLRSWSERHSRRSRPTRGLGRWMATGYVIVATRE